MMTGLLFNSFNVLLSTDPVARTITSDLEELRACGKYIMHYTCDVIHTLI